jgi:apolipoprotein N-acyltransferase
MSFPTAWSPELNLWWMMWFSHFPLLLWLTSEPERAERGARWAFGWSFLCGFIINTGGYYWIADLAQTFGHLPTPVSYVILGLHSALLGLIWGLWGVAVRLLTPRLSLTWVAPLAMVAAEHFMPRIFPAYMGDCQAPFITLMQVADLFGVSAVTFLLYRVNAELTQWFLAWRSPVDEPHPFIAPTPRARLKSLGLTLGLLVMSLVYGSFRIQHIETLIAEAPKLKVGVVEADVGIFESEPASKRRDHLLILQRLSRELVEQGAELIIWSESSYRMSSFPSDLKRVYRSPEPLVSSWREDVKRNTPRRDRVTPLRGFEAPLLMGGGAVERVEGESPRHYNSAWLISKEGEVLGRYDKMVRLVFGEYIPFGDVFPIFYRWLPSASHLTKGEGVTSLVLPHKGREVRLGVLICYEGILPGFARDVVATNPDVLINLTNDDWFGVSAERYLHFVLAQPRAIESRRAFVRSTLTGVSAVVDPVGRVVEWTRPEGEETILREVPLMRPWTLYQVIGDALPWGALLYLLWLAYPLWSSRRAPHAPSTSSSSSSSTPSTPSKEGAST